MERIVLHIDVNSAFLSWSAVKLLEEGYKKDIRNEVAVVAGDPKKKTWNNSGCKYSSEKTRDKSAN